MKKETIKYYASGLHWLLLFAAILTISMLAISNQAGKTKVKTEKTIH